MSDDFVLQVEDVPNAGDRPVDLSKPRPQLVAFCMSDRCDKTARFLGCKKPEVRRGTTDCPDCGHALFWRQCSPTWNPSSPHEGEIRYGRRYVGKAKTHSPSLPPKDY